MRPTLFLLMAFLLFLNLAASPAPNPEPHPDIPDHPAWVRPMLGVVAVLFAAAVPLGFMVRYSMKSEPEPQGAHDAHADHGHAPAAHGHH